MTSRRIILTHIPRTGGTSLFAALKRQQPQVKAIEFDSTAEVALMKDCELNSYGLISSYIGSKLFDRLDGSWLKIVILRDPIARLRSSYCNLRSNPAHISFASNIAKANGFGAFLGSRDPAVIVQATNVQTWSILGDKSMFYREKHATLDEEQISAMAIDRLNNYDLIGFTETLDWLWDNLCLRFEWRASPLPKLRKGTDCPNLDKISRTDLQFHTSLDFILLKAARERTECRVTAPGAHVNWDDRG